MVLNDVTIFYAEGPVSTATFSPEKILSKVASYAIPSETIDTVERTYFNSEKLKKYGTGYGDMSEVTFTIDVDAESIAPVEEMKAFSTARTEVSFGIIVDPAIPEDNVKFSGVITNVTPLDGEIAPGTNGVAKITVKPNTRLSEFVAPTGA